MSGWSVMTVHPPKGLSYEAREQANEMIEKSLQNMYGEDTEGYAERTVQLPRGTASYTEGDFNGIDYAKDVFQRIPAAKWVVIVDANDTGMDGAGELYKVEDGDVKCVDTYVGYEGANGNDVVGYFREEYSLKSYSSWEA